MKSQIFNILYRHKFGVDKLKHKTHLIKDVEKAMGKIISDNKDKLYCQTQNKKIKENSYIDTSKIDLKGHVDRF